MSIKSVEINNRPYTDCPYTEHELHRVMGGTWPARAFSDRKRNTAAVFHIIFHLATLNPARREASPPGPPSRHFHATPHIQP